MARKLFLTLVALSLFLCIGRPQAFAEEMITEKQILVTMRMIGHRVLLMTGDTISRVLPIEKVASQYRIAFEKPFAFQPEALVICIDSVMARAGIADHYIVEVEDTETRKIVHAYERNPRLPDALACLSRAQPEAQYAIWVSLVKKEQAALPPMSTRSTPGGRPYWLVVISIVGLFVVAGFVFFLRKDSIREETDLPRLGSFRFDANNMQLLLGNERTELTSKEADLLNQLYQSRGEVLDRAILLNKVWGDEGAYIGRTLDVYVSKLRKKLAADPQVKIVNIRGVGYKLVVN